MGSADIGACPAFDCCGNLGSCIPDITCLIGAVGNALYGCGGTLPTPTPIPCAVGQCVSTLGYGCTGRACEPEGLSTCEPNEFCDLSGQQCPCVVRPTPTPVLYHGHTCCECADAACVDFAWLEAERACPLGCQTFMDAECDAPCHGGPVGGPAACASLTPCTSDADCDDENGCTIDHCTIDGCTHDCVCR